MIIFEAWDRTVRQLKRSDGILAVFLLLVFAYSTPGITSNEENYLQLAKQYVDPDWIVGSKTLTQFPGTRLIFQWIVGSWLQWFSFESTVVIFRLMLALLFALSLDRLRRVLQFGVMGYAILLMVLYLPRQSFFGGEWLFLGVEAK